VTYALLMWSDNVGVHIEELFSHLHGEIRERLVIEYFSRLEKMENLII
jgi:hypothetical protein